MYCVKIMPYGGIRHVQGDACKVFTQSLDENPDFSKHIKLLELI